MVVSQKMEDAVNEQRGHLLLQRPSSFLGLPARFVDRDNNVSEQSRVDRQIFVDGKGQHVGGIIFVPVTGVLNLHLGIADKRDAQLRARLPKQLQNLERGLLDLAGGKFLTAIAADDFYRHAAIITDRVR
jgi:hypothetical protein